MKLINACKDVLEQLAAVIQDIRDEDFTKPVHILNDSTIGQHIRHTLEFFICLKEAKGEGAVNYDHRNRDRIIESNKLIALKTINELVSFVDLHPENFSLILAVNYDFDCNDMQQVETNYFRELSYNIEHAIHHMAIIKIGLKAVAPYITIPPHFGVAVSTVKYQQEQLITPEKA